MKRFTYLFILVSSALLMAACGSPALTATQVAAQPPASTQAPTQPVATQPASISNGVQVDVILADNTIQASQTTFQAGVPYTFVIKNTGEHAHNFNINPPVSVAGSLDAALANALLVAKQEELSAGAVATVEFTFPASAVGQQLEISCLIRRHYEDGMMQAITVTQ